MGPKPTTKFKKPLFYRVFWPKIICCNFLGGLPKGESLPNCPPKMPPLMGGKQPNCPKIEWRKTSQNCPENRGKQPNFPKIAPPKRGKSAKIASQIAPRSKTLETRTPPENLNFAVFWVLVPFQIGPKHTKLPPHWQKIIPQNRSIFVAFGGAKNQTHTTLPQSYPKTTQKWLKNDSKLDSFSEKSHFRSHFSVTFPGPWKVMFESSKMSFLGPGSVAQRRFTNLISVIVVSV